MQAQGIGAHVIAHNATISARDKGTQWQRALPLSEEVRARGAECNVITHNATISARGKAKQWQCMGANVITHNATISACGKSAKAQRYKAQRRKGAEARKTAWCLRA